MKREPQILSHMRGHDLEPSVCSFWQLLEDPGYGMF